MILKTRTKQPNFPRWERKIYVKPIQAKTKFLSNGLQMLMLTSCSSISKSLPLYTSAIYQRRHQETASITAERNLILGQKTGHGFAQCIIWMCIHYSDIKVNDKEAYTGHPLMRLPAQNLSIFSASSVNRTRDKHYNCNNVKTTVDCMLLILV